MHTSPQRVALGFTLIELMVTVAVLAVIAALATPSFRSILEAQRMRAAAFDLMADLTLARSEALKRGVVANPVTLRPASGDAAHWESGWSVTVGAEVVSRKNPVGQGVKLTGPALVAFDRNGRVSSTTTVAKFALADSTDTRKRCISLDPSGRPKSSTAGCLP